MKKYLFSFFLFLSACTTTSSSYEIGDCLFYDGSEYTYKVLEVGKYGLRVLKPHYDGFEEAIISPDGVKKSQKMDCFNTFEIKGK